MYSNQTHTVLILYIYISGTDFQIYQLSTERYIILYTMLKYFYIRQ